MPYKDEAKRKEAAGESMQKKRQGLTSGVNNEGVNKITMLTRPNGEDYNPDEMLPDGSKRYLGPLSDGQVLDKTTVKGRIPARVRISTGKGECSLGQEEFILRMQACNRANDTRIVHTQAERDVLKKMV